MWREIEHGLGEAFESHAEITAALAGIEAEVADRRPPPTLAAQRLLEIFRKR
jgi:hypothetical protein